ncbi:MAG: ribonuclease III [Pseudomonadota bacterium]
MGRAAEEAAAALADPLGHRFADPDLLEEALTHPSAASPARPHNQRLEFLGDRILGLVIAETLADRHPDEAEGALAPRLNELVRKETCAAVAQEIGLAALLRLGKSEAKTGGRRKTAILGDAMEALIAAVYLDAGGADGGLAAARAAILRCWGPHIEAQGEAPRDAKTHLQEWAQGKGMRPPRYETTGREGPDHAPLFTVSAFLANGAHAEAQARSKRAAEQEAARLLLAAMGAEDE